MSSCGVSPCCENLCLSLCIFEIFIQPCPWVMPVTYGQFCSINATITLIDIDMSMWRRRCIIGPWWWRWSTGHGDAEEWRNTRWRRICIRWWFTTGECDDGGRHEDEYDGGFEDDVGAGGGRREKGEECGQVTAHRHLEILRKQQKKLKQWKIWKAAMACDFRQQRCFKLLKSQSSSHDIKCSLW